MRKFIVKSIVAVTLMTGAVETLNYTLTPTIQADDYLSKKKVKAVNKELKKYLKENKGFAEGTLDENGNPTTNGTPNPDFDYATYVDKITINKSKQANVYFNAKITDLSLDELDEISTRVSSMINGCLMENGRITNDEYKQGTFLSFYYGKKAIGHSKLSNYKTFKWYVK